MTFEATGMSGAAVDDHGWRPKTPPLSTPWTGQVGPGNALPEYPRPQLARKKWLNLNGVWQYQGGGAKPTGGPLPERVLVPYSPESALSGIQRHDDEMWYRRTFEVPKDWRGQRVVLNFGAVTDEARIWVNGKKVGEHRGGYGSFSVDITSALRPGDGQEILVGATAKVEGGSYPIGKQRKKTSAILYTASSGIWQTVWAEPVAATHIEKLDVTPNLASKSFRVTPRMAGARGSLVEVTVSDKRGRVVGKAVTPGDAPATIRIPRPNLWSPASPYLYDITATVLGAHGDSVRSYAGMRSIGLVTDSKGRKRMALNGKIGFQFGPLDQGYWPDGIYTAPTDEALRYDLEQTKAMGFNMVRKHTKVEPDRWYYWADKLGLLVWQDMPALPIDLGVPPEKSPPPTAAMKVNYEHGLRELIDQHRSFPSIVSWVPFNEGWGEFDTARIAAETKRMDPTRLVNADSGVNCCYSKPDSGAGDVYDDHTYVGPGRPTQAMGNGRALVDGEYGGLGLIMKEHDWPAPPSAYEMEDSQAELTQRYSETSDALRTEIADNGLSGAIYTQTTDVEGEVNGLMTYDRRVVKPDIDQVRAHNLAVIAAGDEG